MCVLILVDIRLSFLFSVSALRLFCSSSLLLFVSSSLLLFFSSSISPSLRYGDFTPKKPITIWFLTIFMLFSWAAFVIILGKAGSLQLEREHFWQLNDWGKVMETRGEQRARHHHFVSMSEEEMLAAAKEYVGVPPQSF